MAYTVRHIKHFLITLEVWEVLMQLPVGVEDLVLEQVHLIEEQDDGGVSEEAVIAHRLKQVQALL